MNWVRGAIRRPVTVSMFVLATVLFGWVSLGRLPLNLLPDISYPSLTIQTDYLEAAPEEVEDIVTRPIEEAVGVVPGLTRISSVSRPGQSEVTLEFAWKTNMDLASLDVREKLDSVNLSRDVRRPVLLRFDPSNDPILRVQMTGSLSLSRLRYAAEKEVKKALEPVEGVAAIKVLGGVEEQIHAEIDEKKLGELGIPITEITRILGQENLNQASGSLYDLDANYMVRVLNQFRSVDEIRGVVLRDQGGRRVILGDVARVWRGGKDRETITRLNGKESVELAIYKEGDANAVTVSRAALAKLASMKRNKTFPDGADYEVVFNQAVFIEAAVDDVLQSAWIGGLLAILVLFVFLRDLGSTLTVGLAIPISIMATFAAMYQSGLTLNLMSLGGVALGVGMLVDCSIVVLESVDRHRVPGANLAEAVFRGTKEVGMAITASTATNVAVFAPMIFVEGIAGQLFKDQAVTISYTALSALIVALTLIPMVLAFQLAPTAAAATGGEQEPERRPLVRRALGVWRFLVHDIAAVVITDLRRLAGWLGNLLFKIATPLMYPMTRGYDKLAGAYPGILRWSLDHKGAVMLATLGLACLSAWLATGLGGELIPPMTQGEFTFEIRLPEGRAVEQTSATMKRIEDRVRTDDTVRLVFSSSGGSNKNQFARDLREQHVGQLHVVMKDKADPVAEARAIDRVRGVLREHPDIAYTFSRPTLFSFKTPIEVEIYAERVADMRAASDLVVRRMERIPGLSDITSSARLGSPEIQVRFHRDLLSRLGLDEAEIATMLRNKIRGDVASRYREEDKQIEILVRAGEADRNAVEDIRNLMITRGGARGTTNADPNEQQARTQSTDPLASDNNGSQPGQGQQAQQQPQQPQARSVGVRLGSVATVTTQRGPSEVRRIRGQRAAVVSANLTGRDLTSVTDELRAQLDAVRAELPPLTTVGLGGQYEELESSFRSLKLALGLAVFLVYIVMASEFESLVHPLLILFTVPLGAVGVVFALVLTGTTFNVMVFLGSIVLAGVVVNNAIVLVDYTNQLRDSGAGVREALLEAGPVRLRPIMMTTLTSVLGLVPMALGWGEGAEIRTPMAITVIGGMTVSTLLTLVVIPVLYEMAGGAKRHGT
jgi:HAE1 family hydrophobic/amphiphilic exporter-1